MKVPYLDLKKINQPFQKKFKNVFDEFLFKGRYVLSDQVAYFEKEFADFCGAKYCLGVANGLEALTLILEGYKILGKLNEGDQVIVPANTYIATVLSVSNTGLTPVLVEVNMTTFNIDSNLIEDQITPKTKAIIGVHLYGNLFDIKSLKNLCQKHDLLLIEDAAQAHGALCEKTNQRAGAIGDAAGFSFYPSKNLGALGDGGGITTSDKALYQVVNKLRNYGTSSKYVNEIKGVNSRLDELQAAFLRVKLDCLDQDNQKRAEIAMNYLKGITNVKLTLPYWDQSQSHVFHVFAVLTSNRDQLKAYLLDHGIETLIHYPVAIHKQQAYKELSYLSFPITEQIHQQVLSLPLNPSLEDDQIQYVIDVLNDYA